MGSIAFYTARDMAASQTWYGSVTGATSTQLTISNGYNTGIYFGSFTYVGSTVFGTLNGFDEYAGSTLLVRGINFSVDANLSASYINSNQLQSFFQLALVSNDFIIGSNQTDVLFGYGGKDLFYASFGSDVIDGGDDYDMISFEEAKSWVDVDLSLGIIAGAFGNQTIRNIEVIKGGAYNDHFWGDSRDNLIYGEGGDDIIGGGLGDDLLYGGTGIDTLDYFKSPGSVTINLATKSTTGADGVDYIEGFESVIGSLFSDLIIGDNLDNRFIPYSGDDVIDGGAGADTVQYSFNRSEYSITGTLDNFVVSHLQGVEGTDRLRNIEYLKFEDTSPLAISTLLSTTYALAASSVSVNEGSTTTFTLSSTNVTAGTQVAYTLSGISAADVQGGSLSGTTTVGANGQATISVELLADSLTEGAETLTVTAAGKTASTTINDTSVGSSLVQPGTSGNDTFRITSGSNNIDGGAGSDIVQYQTTRSAASVTYSNGIITIVKADGTDTITGVERIDFTDGDLVFDVTSANAPAAYRLYGGAFARTPDEGGFRFWASTLDQNVSLRDVAAEFISSEEFIGRYGSSLSNAAFVDALYQNVLSRGGDEGGVAHWNRMLDNKFQDRSDVLVEFTQLPEFVGISAANITNGYWVV